MSKRRSNRKPSGQKRDARVDDTLVSLHRLRHEIRETLASQEIEEMTIEEAAELAEEIQAKGPLALQSLLDLLFDDDPEFRRKVVIVLSEIDEESVVEKIHELLLRPNLPEDIRTSLLAVEALHADEPDSLDAESLLPDIPIDSLMSLAEGFWENLEMEEISTMWCENFASQPPEDRLLMLEAIMSTANPKMLGVARIEIGQGDVKILQFLAEKLGEYTHPFAARMLESLLGHSDLVVRTLAGRSQADQQLTGSEQKTAQTAERYRFYRSYMATDDCSGQFSVIYSVRGTDGLIRFLVVLLDRWDRGVVECWGNVRYTEEQFQELISSINRECAEVPHRRIRKGTALSLIHAAMDLNARRNYPIPVDFFAWIHLFEHERFKREPDTPPFGVDCSVCHKPIRTSADFSPWVIGELVVCARCIKRKLTCKTCGGAIRLTECVVSTEPDLAGSDLRCPHCYEVLSF